MKEQLHVFACVLLRRYCDYGGLCCMQYIPGVRLLGVVIQFLWFPSSPPSLIIPSRVMSYISQNAFEQALKTLPERHHSNVCVCV